MSYFFMTNKNCILSIWLCSFYIYWSKNHQNLYICTINLQTKNYTFKPSLNILTHSSLYVSNNSFPCFLLHLRLYLNFATLFYRTSYHTYYITWLVYINFYIYFTPLPFHSYIFFCLFHSRNSLNNSLSSLSVSFPGVRGTLCGPLWSPWRPPICWGPWEEGWLYDVNWFSPPE